MASMALASLGTRRKPPVRYRRIPSETSRWITVSFWGRTRTPSSQQTPVGTGDISVRNLDADYDLVVMDDADDVRTPPADTMATDMPLLSNVIFLSTSGSGFGDISLNQGTDSQSIATASSGC